MRTYRAAAQPKIFLLPFWALQPLFAIWRWTCFFPTQKSEEKLRVISRALSPRGKEKFLHIVVKIILCLYYIFSWESALWTLMSGDTVLMRMFNYKQRLLSLDMKTKVVQHVPRIIFNVSSFQVFRFSGFQVFSFQNFQVPSACLTFRFWYCNRCKVHTTPRLQ